MQSDSTVPRSPHPATRGLVFAKYGTQAASTRQRFVQTIPYLAADSITLDFHYLFDNAYLEHLFSHGKRQKLTVLKAYIARLKQLFHCGSYDFLWVQYELFPYVPWLERLVGLTGKPVILDYDDAIFHQYDRHSNPLIRLVLGKKLLPLLKRSAIAFCGNRYLQAYISVHCRAEIIPTVVDTDIYTSAPHGTAKPKPKLGWIGSPSTWRYCAPVSGIIADFVHTDRLTMLAVGAGYTATRQLPFEFRDWAESREIADIQEMDIGIMPVPDEPWAWGKCGYKLIQYMACGIPVIASPVGVNCEIVEHGVNGFLASTEQEWREAIEKLLVDAPLRWRMGEAGRKKVIEHYSIQRYGPRVAQLIREIAA